MRANRLCTQLEMLAQYAVNAKRRQPLYCIYRAYYHNWKSSFPHQLMHTII
jgi:hypothetical protein